VRAEYRLDVEAPEGLAASADCLERTLVAQPQNSDAASILARLLVDPRTTDKDTDPKVRALDLATRAAAIAPLSDRAQVALMMTQFYNGRPEAAIQSGNRALALNPNNPDSSADLALVLYFSGFHDAGLALAQDAARSAGSAPRNAQLVLALDAYGKEDWSSASMYAEQITGNDILVGGLRTASLAQLGSGEAGQALAEVRTRFPDFTRIFPREMAARRVPAELSSAIEDGLRRATIPYRPDALASAH
jgi:tetratricopeptide (TPR) repeat protein